jgi:predicted HTH transcriptional regulator
MIEIFTNRIEVTNPGKPLINIDRFIDHSPQSRNEMFASLMRRMGMCEERGSGVDKVIYECELHQLPAPDFFAEDAFTRVIIYAPREFREMDKADKIRATYQHCVLKFIAGEYMTNQSLRDRFGIDEKNYPMVSRIINDAKDADRIKDLDPSNKANKHFRYIPYWA